MEAISFTCVAMHCDEWRVPASRSEFQRVHSLTTLHSSACDNDAEHCGDRYNQNKMLQCRVRVGETEILTGFACLSVFAARRSVLGRLLLWRRGCRCGCLCVCHVDVLHPND